MIRRIAFLACLAALACRLAPAAAGELKAPVIPVTTPAVAIAAAPPSGVAPAQATDAQAFCRNVATAAADARFALQTRRLDALQGEIGQRVEALEAKEAELKDLLARHDEALKQAQASLVAIYAKMRPDAAAQQIAALDDTTAAALLQGLNARQSSAILNEIPTERAVKLVAAIQALAAPEGKKS